MQNIVTSLRSAAVIAKSLERSYRVLPPDKRYSNVLSNNFRKIRRIVVIFAKQHRRKEKLTVQRKCTSTN